MDRIQYNPVKIIPGRLVTALLAAFFFSSLRAQEADTSRSYLKDVVFAPVLRMVEKNNLQLKSAHYAGLSTLSDMRSENSLGTTSVEYSPFYSGGISGLASSELIVSQEVDFPTLYAARNKGMRSAGNVIGLEYSMLRRDILIEAWQLCIDLWAAERREEILKRRLGMADSLVYAVSRRMERGEATKLDENRVRLGKMTLMAEYGQNAVEIDRLRHSLQALNGGIPVDSVWRTVADVAVLPACPVPEGLGGVSLENLVAEANLTKARQDVKISRQGWLPTLTVGYRRNTDGNEAFHGFIVGASFPLFSASGRMKSARHRQAAAEWQLLEAEASRKARLKSILDEALGLDRMLQAYNDSLMSQTLSLLESSVLHGEMPLSEYLSESELIFVKMQEKLDLEVRLQKVYSTLVGCYM
ncbi:MAG: TolC family protein [Bacteroidaceae bacterium]